MLRAWSRPLSGAGGLKEGFREGQRTGRPLNKTGDKRLLRAETRALRLPRGTTKAAPRMRWRWVVASQAAQLRAGLATGMAAGVAMGTRL